VTTPRRAPYLTTCFKGALYRAVAKSKMIILIVSHRESVERLIEAQTRSLVYIGSYAALLNVADNLPHVAPMIKRDGLQ
jgi:hypothetical protein